MKHVPQFLEYQPYSNSDTLYIFYFTIFIVCICVLYQLHLHQKLITLIDKNDISHLIQN